MSVKGRRSIQEIAAHRAAMEGARATIDMENRIANLEWRSSPGLIAIKLFSDTQTVAVGVRWILGVTEADQLAGKLLTAAGTYISTVSSSGLVTLQLENLTSGNPMLSTPLNIDAGEKFSDTAASQYVIDAGEAEIALHDEIAFDVTAAGAGAKGLSIVMRCG